MTDFTDDVLGEASRLRRFARSLCPTADLAEDLMQDTMVVAIRMQKRFQPGTNLRAWLFTIMKNVHRNNFRKSQRRVSVVTNDICDAQSGKAEPSQEISAALSETTRVIHSLPAEQRAVLVLIAIYGLSYQEAAEMTGAPIGTVRSRLARARRRLTMLLRPEIGGE